MKIALSLLALLVATGASAEPIFPPLVSGQYSFYVHTAPVVLDVAGVPLTAPTRSIGIYGVTASTILLEPRSIVPIFCMRMTIARNAYSVATLRLNRFLK